MDLETVLRQLRPLSDFGVVVDVGANIGQSAARFLDLFPNATIFSLEPDPIAFESLEGLSRENSRVRAFRLGLSEQPGKLELNVNAANFTNSFLPVESSASEFIDPAILAPTRRQTTSVLTLPDFCSSVGIDHIDFLKLDTQGFEDRILRGCSDWLTPERVWAIYTEVLFMKIYSGQAHFDVVLQILRERGFKLHSFHDMESKPPIGLMWGDALFVRSEA